MFEDYANTPETIPYNGPPIKGRGSSQNPMGRFEKLDIELDPEVELAEDPDFPPRKIKTQVFKDTSRTILSTNDSPDIGMDMTLNPYRGCEHGCIYCYARPSHEYLGLSAGLDFETKIFAKTDAPVLLREKLKSKNWKPQVVTMSGITDCYQPIEKKLEITRQCLQVFAEFRNPVAIITKNHLVTRDIDILSEMAKWNGVCVVLSITSLNRQLARVLEPRTAQPSLRLRTMQQLSEAGIPVSVNMAPIIPGLTDHEIPNVLEEAAKAGARSAHYTMVRLPYGVKELFVQWLDEHEPLKKEKILSRIRAMRGGNLYNAEFGTRMRGEGVFAQQMAAVFAHSRKRFGLDKPYTPLSTDHFRNADERQMPLL